MRLLLFIIVSLILISTSAQEINIIPKPQQLEMKRGNFLFDSKIDIVYNDVGSANISKYLSNEIKKRNGIILNICDTHPYKYQKTIILDEEPFPNKEAYEIVVESKTIIIKGSENGLFLGVQTLLQLLPNEKQKTSWPINCLSIKDAPRFQYRGMHLDIGRHFQPISFIKLYIDFLAYHKLNKFHWHLTEDQGWRIEIKKYPELTKIGSKRNGTIIGRYPGKGNDNKPHQGFYTQAEIKEVVQYAKERFIEVIPEIEMPGHSSAAIAAYPWLSCFPEKPTSIPANMISAKSIEEQKNGRIKLVQETWGVFDDVFCAGNDSTFSFLQNVIDEVIKLFPSKYFHIGGDECPKTHWKICSRCQQRMKELNLKDEHELQSYFVQRMEKYLNSKGKTLIGWDEILEGGLAPNAIVMSWRGEAGGIEAAKQKHQVIMTPGKPVYFDHTQTKNEDSVTIGGYNPIEAVYAYNPVPKELNADESKYVLGAQANVWTEYMNNTKKIEYMIFPRMAALSEVLWSNAENKSWDDFEKRLMVQMKRYEMMELNYSKAYFDLTEQIKPTETNDGLLWILTPKLKSQIINIGNEPGHHSSSTYKEPIKINSSSTYRVSWKDTLSNISKFAFYKQFIFSKSTGKKITLTTPASNSYPGDGAFTLVNGIINEKGLARSQEFIGFSGTDCEAVIDLGKADTIRNVTAHIFSQPSSWIWPPYSFSVQTSMDGINFTPNVDAGATVMNENKVELNFGATVGRFVKVFIKNKGIIPNGNPGAGKQAWLFLSEVQVF